MAMINEADCHCHCHCHWVTSVMCNYVLFLDIWRRITLYVVMSTVFNIFHLNFQESLWSPCLLPFEDVSFIVSLEIILFVGGEKKGTLFVKSYLF